MPEIVLDNNAKIAWQNYLENQINNGHTRRMLIGRDINEHVNTCLFSAYKTVANIKEELDNFIPKRILEIGCSAGLNCFALRHVYSDAEIFGIEPESQAVLAAEAMGQVVGNARISFLRGLGEKIPLSNASIDLIICHTVIEHVQDVGKVISEMTRVLTPVGVIHLEAPNYVWPYEPHLDIWTIPKLGKNFVRMTAILQARKEMVPFLNHLQFVTSFQLERIFRKNYLFYENRVKKKVLGAVDGTADIKKYKFLSRMLARFGKIGITKFIVSLVLRLGMYPSVMYTLRKAPIITK